jgi:hypothetical protein
VPTRAAVLRRDRIGMGLPMAVTDKHEGDRIDCLVTGVYVSPDLMGIATHGGERTTRTGYH